MKTRRPISINNSLAHGLCNYSCRLCGINKDFYSGPREFQSYSVTRALIQSVLKAAESGIQVRYIANSGDGEATLHPEFKKRMRMFGEMLREWNIPGVPVPEVSVVTNGSRLNIPGIMDPFLENSISLIISLPTVKPESYGLIMQDDSGMGEILLSRVLPGVEKAMLLRAEGQLSKLLFHISPPETSIIRHDFHDTIEYLTSRASGSGLKEIDLVLFPAASNRSGLIRNTFAAVDMYKDLFRRYSGQAVNGVNIRMQLVLKRFFFSLGEIADLVRCFRFPCLWNANFFIAADGSSVCCNDQSIRNPQGNILSDSIASLMRYKEQFMPGSICAGCNQSPDRLNGSPEALLFSTIVKIRLWSSGIRHGLLSSKNELAEEVKRIGKDEDDVLSDPTLPDSIEEIIGAFRLVYKAYLSSGFQIPDPSLMRITFHNLLPASVLITVGKNGKVCGTLALIQESDAGLPINELFDNEIRKFRRKDSLICELSGLAVDASLSKSESRAVLLSLFRKAFVVGHDLLGCTDFCMMVNPRHCDYYQREFNFEKIGQIRKYDKVNGAPAIPLRLNITYGSELFRKINPGLYRYFFVEDHQMIKERSYHELRNQKKILNIRYIESLAGSKKDVLTDLTEEERKILCRYYPELKWLNL